MSYPLHGSAVLVLTEAVLTQKLFTNLYTEGFIAESEVGPSILLV